MFQNKCFYCISQLVPALWVNLAIRIPLCGSLKFKVGFVVKLFRIYRQVFLTFIARGSLKLSHTLNYAMKRANDLKTVSN